jgi:CBS domain-containing protein
MAIGGPLVSLALALLCGGLHYLAATGGWAGPWGLITLEYLTLINGVMLLFNMIPAFPLDGGRVLRSILWWLTGNLRRATFAAAMVGQLFAGVLLVGSVVELFLYAHDLPQFIGAFWLGVIGLFLHNAAKAGYQQVVVREALRGEPVRRLMTPQPVVVPPQLDLRHWVEDYVYRHHRKSFPVARDGRLEGYISTQALRRLPRDEWPLHTVAEVMRRDIKPLVVAPDSDAWNALAKMERTGAQRLWVMEDDRLVGTVTHKDLLHFLQLKLELHDGNDAAPEAPRNAA